MIALSLMVSCSSKKSNTTSFTDKEVLGNIMESGFTSDEYCSALNASRVSIEEHKRTFDEQVENIKKYGFQKMNFENADFIKNNEFQSVNVLEHLAGSDNISVEDSIKAFETEIENRGLSSEIDLKVELRDASGDAGQTDDMGAYPYNYGAVFDNLDKVKSGDMFFIVTPKLSLQMLGSGFYSMSDGKVPAYSGSGISTHLDSLGESVQEVVEYDYYDKIKDKEYRLLDSDFKICDAAENVIKYFTEESIFKPYEGVSLEAYDVTVFKVKDIYAYYFLLRGVYKGIPFSASRPTSYRADYQVTYDTKRACTMDGKTVNSYVGTVACQVVDEKIEDQHSILTMEQAAHIAETSLADRLTFIVERVELQYSSWDINKDDRYHGRISFPCWEFTGVLPRDNRGMKVLVDALTGEVISYTFAIK